MEQCLILDGRCVNSSSSVRSLRVLFDMNLTFVAFVRLKNIYKFPVY